MISKFLENFHEKTIRTGAAGPAHAGCSMTMLAIIQAMKHSPLQNYGGVPGLTSWLIGTPGPHGMVRLMECSRTHQEPIIPHSHRFDLHCRVLAGHVRNVLWERHRDGDSFSALEMTCAGPGSYGVEQSERDISRWSAFEATYGQGEEYSMRADEVHSIYFSRGTSVLFFEGAQKSDKSIVLEPFVDGIVVPTFRVPDWAFKLGEEVAA